MRVIGAGFGRTGTMSLKVALEQLGFGPCYHMMEVFGRPDDVPVWQAAGEGKSVDWKALFADWGAAVDWPTAAFYRDLMEVYPEAKIILTVRDADRWYESIRATIYPSSTGESVDPAFVPTRRMIDTVIWQGTFGGEAEDRAHAIGIYLAHNEAVKKTVPPERLLVYELKEGWEPLCRFLGVDVPDGVEFPRLNDTASFNQRQEEQRVAAEAEAAAQ